MERQNFDGEYVRRLIDGDHETERNFVDYFDELLTMKLRSRLRSPELVQDVKQETFLRVLNTLRQRGGLENAASLGAFVNAVSNNILFETYRAQAKAPAELPEDVGGNHEHPVDTLISQERTEQVRKLLSDIPAKDSQILRMLFYEQRDKDEVCRTLGVDRGYLRVLIHRAKSKLRDAVQKKSEIARRS